MVRYFVVKADSLSHRSLRSDRCGIGHPVGPDGEDLAAAIANRRLQSIKSKRFGDDRKH
jgi:hypothetical protein